VGITDVTTAAAWIVGLAIVALIAAGWRKRARATADPARARLPSRAPVGIPMEDVHAPLYRPASIWRRVWSLGAATVIAIITGAVLATFLGFGPGLPRTQRRPRALTGRPAGAARHGSGSACLMLGILPLQDPRLPTRVTH